MFRISLRFALGAATAAAIVAASGQHVRAADHPPPLAIGAAAPDFSLPGVDGKTYTLASFKDAKALVVVFTAVHCPTAEVYEARLKKLVADYAPKGVAFAVIQPNNAKAVRLDEMGYTDLGDSLEDMKMRAEHRAFNFPFLYDGETQEATAKYGPVATPHVFVFDQASDAALPGPHRQQPARGLRQGRRHAARARRRARRRPVPVEKTPTVGCSIKWLDKTASTTPKQDGDQEGAGDGDDRRRRRPRGAGQERRQRQDAADQLLGDVVRAVHRGVPGSAGDVAHVRKRPFELVTVAINFPDEEPGVRRFLEAQHATTQNLLFGTTDPYELMKVVDPDWNGAVPYSMVIAPGGKVLYKGNGTLDILKTRRMILASFPDDDYVGQNALLEQQVAGDAVSTARRANRAGAWYRSAASAVRCRRATGAPGASGTAAVPRSASAGRGTTRRESPARPAATATAGCGSGRCRTTTAAGPRSAGPARGPVGRGRRARAPRWRRRPRAIHETRVRGPSGRRETWPATAVGCCPSAGP